MHTKEKAQSLHTHTKHPESEHLEEQTDYIDPNSKERQMSCVTCCLPGWIKCTCEWGQLVCIY